MAATVRAETVKSATITNDQATVDGRIVESQEGQAGRVLVAAAVVSAATWGSTATTTIPAGSKGRRGRVSVASAGTGQTAAATITITFPEGAYRVAPVAYLRAVSGTDLGYKVDSVTVTALVIGVVSVPVAANTYVVEYVLFPA